MGEDSAGCPRSWHGGNDPGRETERTVERLVTLAEPAMIVPLGVVGLVALALLKAVYSPPSSGAMAFELPIEWRLFLPTPGNATQPELN